MDTAENTWEQRIMFTVGIIAEEMKMAWAYPWVVEG